MVDRNDQLMKPFIHGWKREIVYRNTIEKEKPKMDVYYYPPDHKKLRSSNEVINYLKTHPSELSPSCFTFAKKHLHHEPHEIVRLASKRKSKDSMESEKFKKLKTVKGNILDQNKIEGKNDFKKIENDRKVENKMDLLKLPSPSSSFNEDINACIDKKLMMKKFLMNFDTSVLKFKSLLKIFKYLSVKDLLATSMTCKTWRKASLHHTLWDGIKLRGINITNWKKAAEFFNKRGTRYINFDDMRIEPSIPLETYWSNFADFMVELKFLKFINLGLCSTDAVYTLAYKSSFELIQGLTCTIDTITGNILEDSMQSAHEPKKSNVELNMQCLRPCTRLKVLKISSNNKFSIASLGEISSLENLQALSLTTVTGLKENGLECLKNLPQLQVFEYGFCCGWQKWVFDSLSQCKHLSSLKLSSGEIEIHRSIIDHNLLWEFFNTMNKLKHLDLINFIITKSIIDILAELNNLKALVIHAMTDKDTTKTALNDHLIRKSKTLNFLEKFEWRFVTNSNENQNVINDCNTVDINEFEGQLSLKMPSTKIILN